MHISQALQDKNFDFNHAIVDTDLNVYSDTLFNRVCVWVSSIFSSAYDGDQVAKKVANWAADNLVLKAKDPEVTKLKNLAASLQGSDSLRNGKIRSQFSKIHVEGNAVVEADAPNPKSAKKVKTSSSKPAGKETLVDWGMENVKFVFPVIALAAVTYGLSQMGDTQADSSKGATSSNDGIPSSWKAVHTVLALVVGAAAQKWVVPTAQKVSFPVRDKKDGAWSEVAKTTTYVAASVVTAYLGSQTGINNSALFTVPAIFGMHAVSSWSKAESAVPYAMTIMNGLGSPIGASAIPVVDAVMRGYFLWGSKSAAVTAIAGTTTAFFPAKVLPVAIPVAKVAANGALQAVGGVFTLAGKAFSA